MKHKIAVVLAALILAFSFTGVTAFAEKTYSEGYFYYTKGEGCVIITGYFGKDEVAVVPDNIAGYPVSVIAKGAFVGTNAKEIYLPATIMEIEQGAIAEGIEVFYSGAGIDEPDTDTPSSSASEDDSGKENKKNDNKKDKKKDKKNNGTDGNKDDYQPLVQPERDENGNVAEGVNEGPEKIYVDEDGKLIEDPEEIKAIDKQQEAARQADQQSESTGINGWLIAGISFAVIAAAGITYYIIRKSKKYDYRKDDNYENL